MVGIGGGSVLDAAKLVHVANLAGDFAVDRRVWAERRETPNARLICIPTTAGSGSELTATSSLWDGGTKSSIDGPALFPSDAIYDSTLLASATTEIRVAALWDAMTHALEALWSRQATARSDGYASFALCKIVDTLRRHGGPVDAALDDLALASAAAGAAITVTRTGIAHALSYPLTAEFGLRHGLAAGLFGMATASLLPELAPATASHIESALHEPLSAIENLWRGTGAAELTGRTVSRAAIRAQASATLNPDRARLSVVTPTPEIVAEICERASTIVGAA